MLQWQTYFGFKNPPIAIVLFILFGFTMALVVVPHAGTEKLGLVLGTGLGVGYLINAAKAMTAQAWRIAIWMVAMGCTLFVCAVWLTPDSVFVGSVLDDYGQVLLGAMLGLAAKVEEA